MEKNIAGMILVAALAMVTACGDSLDVNNTAPRGSVGGILVDAITRMPIVGAQVSVQAGGEVRDADPTDDTGAFGVDDVRAGDVIVTITPVEGSGYRGAWVRDHLVNNAGEFPAHNTLTLGPIGLVPAGPDFTMRVLDANGGPVSTDPPYMVTLRHFVEYVDFKSGTGESEGEVVMQASTGADGRVTFAGFPDFFGLPPGSNDTVVAHLPPLANGTAFDYPGGAQIFNMRDLTDPTPDVILDPVFAANLTVRASTIAQLVTGLGAGTHATVININDTIHIAFNLPIRDDAVVIVSDERGNPLATQPQLSMSDDNLAVNFGNDPLLPGNEYNIQIHATSAVTGLDLSTDLVASFFTAPINDEVTVANISRPSANQIRVEFSEPIGIGNATATILDGPTNCVLYFNVDIDAAGGIGNYPGERGHPDCWGGQNQYLYSVEPDPIGMPSVSGFTRFWEFAVPAAATTGTRVDIILSRVASSTLVVERADGRIVADFKDATSIPLP